METVGEYQKELSTLLQTIKKCIPIAISAHEKLNTTQIESKTDGTVVSICDFALQCIVMNEIKHVFPNDPILGEEDINKMTPNFLSQVQTLLPPGLTPSDACSTSVKTLPMGRCWVLDPIDGTYGFVNNGHYGIALALLIDRQPIVTGIGWPNHDPKFTGFPVSGPSIFVAIKGKGTFGCGMDLNLIDCKPLRQQIPKKICLFSDFKPGKGTQLIKAVAKDFNITEELSMVSMTKGIIMGLGMGLLYIRVHYTLREYVWDIAPFILFFEELGGICCTAEGTKITFAQDGMVNGGEEGLIFVNGDQDFLEKIRQSYIAHIPEFYT